MTEQASVYILTNQHNTTLYIGVTSNLEQRLYEHRNKVKQGFTAKYNLNKLVYFEVGNSIQTAIEREKYIKGKTRAFKNSLIASMNPEWRDLLPPCHPERSEGSPQLLGRSFTYVQDDVGLLQSEKTRHPECSEGSPQKAVCHVECNETSPQTARGILRYTQNDELRGGQTA
jgi:putative endonuclease